MTLRQDEDDSLRLTQAFRDNGSDLLAYLQRRMFPREEAADVLSETMTVAWRRVAALPADPIQARMWLFAVARNTLLNSQRGNRRRDAAADRLREVLAVTLASESNSDAALDVRAAIGRLPKAFAEVVCLVHWDGFTLNEAAELCGIPAATARSRYARAKHRLAADLRSHARLPAVLLGSTG